MARTERELKESLKLADLIIEVIDARIPKSSVNPDFEKLFAGKRRIYVLNKADLADPLISETWINHFKNGGGSPGAASQGGGGYTCWCRPAGTSAWRQVSDHYDSGSGSSDYWTCSNTCRHLCDL